MGMKQLPNRAPVAPIEEAPAAEAVTEARPNRHPNRLTLSWKAGVWVKSALRKLGEIVGNPILDLEILEGLRTFNECWEEGWAEALRAAGITEIQTLDDDKGLAIWSW